MKPAALPEAVIDQAIAWHVQLQSGLATVQHKDACRVWRAAHPDHELAWRRITGFSEALQQVPAPLAHATLASQPALVSRRTLLRSLALTAGAGTVLLAAPADWWPRADSGQYLATGIGERRTLRLADDSALSLNAETTLSVDFTPQSRHLALQQGDIFVQTAADAGRPFEVSVGQGRIRALGTRFMVREHQGMTRVAVYEGAVEVVSSRSPHASMQVPAGHALRFSANGLASLETASLDDAAWLQGRLVAHSMRLGDLLGELGHYRHGLLRCDQAAADLRVSGVFSLNDSDQALAVVARTLPVRIRQITPLWVSVMHT